MILIDLSLNSLTNVFLNRPRHTLHFSSVSYGIKTNVFLIIQKIKSKMLTQ